MCGMILMSSFSPPSPSSHSSTSSLSCRSSSNALASWAYTHHHPFLPATKAVDDLLLGNNKERVNQRCSWPGSVNMASSTKSTEGGGGGGDLLQFPAIEWCFSDDEDDESFSEDMDSSVQSAPTTSHHASESKAPRRGSLVRSISLVGSIMHEMQLQHSKKMKKRSKKKALAHKRNRTKAARHHRANTGRQPSDRLLPLGHALKGLQAAHHEGAQKYFLA